VRCGRNDIKRAIGIVAIVVTAGALWLLWPRERAPAPVEETLSVMEIMAGADTAGFARAVSPRPFDFPADHGPHPLFRTEWWYYTGNLASADGERFGFQLTFFRSALAPTIPEGPSAWRTNQIYMAHFGLTDARRNDFRAWERFGRAANGLAGARAVPFRVWLDDWYAEAVDAADSSAVPAMRLYAGEGGWTVDVRVVAEKGPILQGEDGLSQKGSGVGNASYYYSLTRMSARGAVRVAGRDVPVTGTVWMDREWSTSALEPGQAGWDWFALQLSDGTELMYYRVRRDDGSTDPRSRGSFVDGRGAKTGLNPSELRLDVLDRWNSPRGGDYPSRWHVVVDTVDLDVEVVPLLADQELDLSFRYWEGAVRVFGTRTGERVTGVGYVELTGYAQ
jgi:predicted secreted hydrolase